MTKKMTRKEQINHDNRAINVTLMCIDVICAVAFAIINEPFMVALSVLSLLWGLMIQDGLESECE